MSKYITSENKGTKKMTKHISIRKYSDYSLKECINIILSEIVDQNKSVGWSGNIDDKNQIAEYLDKFNVHYSCDFTGTWKNKHI